MVGTRPQQRGDPVTLRVGQRRCRRHHARNVALEARFGEFGAAFASVGPAVFCGAAGSGGKAPQFWVSCGH